MLSRTIIIFGGMAALAAESIVSSVHADPFLPVPPASFLDYHVSTARGLSEEVAADVVVRARLARHFGLSEPSVVGYVRRNLVETTLTASQAGRYRVACISPSGREYWVSERLGAGTPVFALATTGQPILRLACGNPLTSVLPAVSPPPIQKVKPAVLALSPKTVPVAAPPVAAVTEQTFAFQAPLVAPEVDHVGPITQVGDLTQSLGHSSKGLGFIPAAVGLVGLTTLHHHSTPPPATPPSPAVPEPSTLTLFGGFGGAILAMQAKWRKKQG